MPILPMFLQRCRRLSPTSGNWRKVLLGTPPPVTNVSATNISRGPPPASSGLARPRRLVGARAMGIGHPGAVDRHAVSEIEHLPDLRRHLFAEDLHLVDQLLHRVGGEVEAEQMGDAGFAEGV